jgi:hypothetical protein
MRAAGRDEGHGQRGGLIKVRREARWWFIISKLVTDGFDKILNQIFVVKRPGAVTRFDDIVFAASRLEWQAIFR